MKLQILVLLLASTTGLSADPWKPPPGDSSTLAESALTDVESERFQMLTHRVIRSAQGRSELSDGFRYLLDNDTAKISEVAEWISLERKNCPFVSFTLRLTPAGDLTLDLRGPDGVKELLQMELPALAPHYI
ncbi:hypothetical protein [uncultured Paludibaculum sp.]|uniref:hypothetical protein n=1 Tax=uncultured Paludibaculum sp. TaxID=1765020 RepID=UPI002AAB7166|nr:hypothetical protein [uncultured Paludibaculum sp.]